MGIWSDFKIKSRRKHPWLFATYTEFPSERQDGLWYEAFLFRNEDRTTFGLHEFNGDLPQRNVVPSMAKRCVTDEQYRQSMISEDKEIKKWWKKH